MTRLSLALVTALATTPLAAAAQPPASAPAAPAARPWQVDWGQYFCGLIRKPDAGRHFFTAFMSIPGGTGMTIKLVPEQGTEVADDLDNVLLLPGGTSFPVHGERGDAVPVRIHTLFGLPLDFRERLVDASELELRSGDRVVARVPLDGVRGGLAAQRQCLTEVAREWGIDEAALAALSRRPSSPNSLGLTPNDYPTEAVNRNEQGRVAVRIAVGADGRASECVVVASSGSRALDATTCRVALSRGRVEPRRDAGGPPVATRVIFLTGFSMPDG